MSEVLMINSVGEYAAGEEYLLPEETADRFIVLGYAEGELSREFSEEEVADLHEPHQAVTL